MGHLDSNGAYSLIGLGTHGQTNKLNVRVLRELEQRFDGDERLQLILVICLYFAVEGFDRPAQLF
ncbi:hypothetical protein HRbin07_00228 [bacterium HR07]|nr:hypothetical protein HRbin07_00228 [bacterium HR07]